MLISLGTERAGSQMDRGDQRERVCSLGSQPPRPPAANENRVLSFWKRGDLWAQNPEVSGGLIHENCEGRLG